jgi:hypothetical protein
VLLQQGIVKEICSKYEEIIITLIFYLQDFELLMNLFLLALQYRYWIIENFGKIYIWFVRIIYKFRKRIIFFTKKYIANCPGKNFC